MYKNTNKFVQFELWKSCTIGCKFCCNKGQKDVDKQESIRYVMSKLDEKDILNYNEIGFIGGEFFNGELDSVKQDFYSLFEKVSKMHFSKIYITAALIYDLKKDLLKFLDYLKELRISDKVILCTSFDVKYRFHTQEKKELWKNNILYLKEFYPELRLHTEIILTEWFLNAVLNNDFVINNFKNVFNTSVDYIEPSSGLFFKDKFECEKSCPGFFPKKSSFIKFLKKCYEENSIDFNTFLSMELRSNTLYYLENENKKVAMNRRDSDGRCEISDKTKKYDIGFIDSNKKMYQVAQEFYRMCKGN